MTSNLKKALILTLLTLFITQSFEIILSSKYLIYLFPENAALQDFEYSDFMISDRKVLSKNKDIIIVNVGNLTRREIGTLISTINEYKPKVIGINLIFSCQGDLRDTINCPQLRDSIGVRMLSEAIKSAKNVVLGTNYTEDSPLFEYSDSIYSTYARNGYADLPGSTMVRDFWPYHQVVLKDQKFNSFAMEVCRLYDSSAAYELSRKVNSEPINFRGNIDDRRSSVNGYFDMVDVGEISDQKLNRRQFEGKIVLLGFLGDSIGSSNAGDKVFTPLNNKPLGKSFPDMYVTVVHANIIAMILNRDYIYELLSPQEYLMAFIFCFFHILILLWLLGKYGNLYDLFSIVFILLILCLIAGLRFALFNIFSIQADLSTTLGSLAIAGVVVNVSIHTPRIFNSITKKIEVKSNQSYWVRNNSRIIRSMNIVVLLVIILRVPFLFFLNGMRPVHIEMFKEFQLPYIILFFLNLLLWIVMRFWNRPIAKAFGDSAYKLLLISSLVHGLLFPFDD